MEQVKTYSQISNYNVIWVTWSVIREVYGLANANKLEWIPN